MFVWFIKKIHQKFQKRKHSKLPRKRRIFDYEAEPLIDQLKLNFQFSPLDIQFGTLNEKAPKHLVNKDVEILFYSKQQCEVQLIDKESSSFFLPTEYIDFSPFLFPKKSSSYVGKYAKIITDIKSDDEIKGFLGKKNDIVLVFHYEKESDLPYWVKNERTNECFKVRKEEIAWTDKQLPIEII